MENIQQSDRKSWADIQDEEEEKYKDKDKDKDKDKKNICINKDG